MISTKNKEFIVEYRPTSIRAARVSSLKPPVVVEELFSCSLNQDETDASTMREFAKIKQNAYMMSHCTIYPERRTVRRVTIDSGRGKETDFIFDLLKNELKTEADDVTAFCLSPESGAEIDPSDYNKKNVLVCAAAKEEILDIQQSLLKIGVYPRRAEIGTISLIGIIKETVATEKASQPILFLEVEDEFSSAIIVGPEGIEMSRRIDTGYAHIASALKLELNLKDEAAAEKLLASTDFDFGSFSKTILKKMIRELQSSIGFFEVQTGQSISRLHCVRHHSNLNWFQDSLSQELNLDAFNLDISSWLESKNIKLSENESTKNLDLTWLGLLSLLCEFEKEKAA